ncbi:MAG: photosystem reaction center subunit H [Sphingomonas sp. 28-62-20]|uniref:PRC-barrel domain-containing protein n=1 Tax=Sphingomonas sp. 28-62-20 TaxID=1970433 RepID=UPI000BD92067|nr:MAG: photosystem reaction center subunit H [Sphingomonas sp. 28-62-20]
MAFDTNSNTLERTETRDLISSDKVDGTAVYNREKEKLGTIHHFMVGKRTGKVEYAVMSFGGLFGMGEDYYPLPWKMLDYDTDKGGYCVNISKDQLTKEAPTYKKGSEPNWTGDFGGRVDAHYGRMAA